jgi:hypothetical protein
MGLLRSLILTVAPGRLRRAMEAESRSWVARCPCGAETSVWQMGGIRYGAAGNPRRLLRCGSCRRTFFGTLEYDKKPVGDVDDSIG